MTLSGGGTTENDANGSLYPDDEDDETARMRMFDELTADLFGGNHDDRKKNRPPPPTNPFAASFAAAPAKSSGSLYDDDELLRLLSTHESTIADEILSDDDDIVSGVSFSLHDLVLNAIDDAAANPDLLRRARHVRAVASDVDGTLLGDGQTLHPRTLAAVRRAAALASSSASAPRPFFFFPATGKTRRGALDSLGPEVAALLGHGPGVYIQGLYCVDGDDNVVFERRLSTGAVRAVESLAEAEGLSIVAYDGDDLYTTEVTSQTQRLHTQYGEPLPAPTATPLHEHDPGMHKILLLDDDVFHLKHVVRPKLEALALQLGDTVVTQALPDMLEWLPVGCSKAVGVRKLCEALGIVVDTELLALGDAENDADLLQEASIGVAMGNGCPLAKERADHVVRETSAEGGAGRAMELFGFGYEEGNGAEDGSGA